MTIKFLTLMLFLLWSSKFSQGNSPPQHRMVFIGCRLTERKGGTAWKAKLPANKEEDSLCDFVKRGIRRFLKKDTGVETVQDEKGYFNHKDRKLKLPDICIHCGEEGAEDSLLSQPQLIERKLTGGEICFPICADCLKCGKTVLKTGRKDAMNVRKEKAGSK